MDSQNDPLIAECEELGEEKARRKYLDGGFGIRDGRNNQRVKQWLDDKERSRKESREEEALTISKKALFNSRLAEVVAVIAIIFSVASGLGWIEKLTP